jgi:hypothetical protein
MMSRNVIAYAAFWKPQQSGRIRLSERLAAKGDDIGGRLKTGQRAGVLGGTHALCSELDPKT